MALLFKEYGITDTGTELLQSDVLERLTPAFHSAGRDDALYRVGQNAAHMLQSLPHNSPYRIPMLALLMPGLSNNEIHDALGMTRHSVNRAAEHIGKGSNVFLDTKQTQGISRVQFFFQFVVVVCLLFFFSL
jgi:hypothetical protein